MQRRSGSKWRWAAMGPALFGISGLTQAASELEALTLLERPRLEPSPVDALSPPPVPILLHLELSFAPRWHTGSDMQAVYSSAMYQVGVAGRYELKPGLGLRLGVAYAGQDGIGVGRNSGEISEETTRMTLVPIELGVTYHLQQLRLASVVPYLSAGLDAHLFKEEIGETRVGGAKWGVHGRFGLDVQLEGPAPSWTSDSRSGVRSTSLQLEVGYSGVSSFQSTGLDLSGILLQVGFGLGF